MQVCFAPSQYVVDDTIVRGFAALVEKLIQSDYCAHVGGCFPFDPRKGGPQTDYFDTFRGPHPCNDFAEYLAKHNSNVQESTAAAECLAEKGPGVPAFAIPDIVRHAASGLGEFYEIKPNSASGRAKGKKKIDDFEDVIARYHLPYESGLDYRPDERFTMWDGAWQGCPIEISLHYWLESDGLILYEICFDSGVKQFSEVAIAMLVQGAIALALLTGVGELSPVLILRYLILASSPLVSPIGPPDGVPAINDQASLFYIDLLTVQREERRGHPVNGFFYVAMVAGSDPPETWDPGDPRPWVFDAATMAAIGDIAPDGRIDPGSDAIHALETDQLQYVGSCLTTDDRFTALAGCFVGEQLTAEDGDTEPINAEDVVPKAITAYLKSFQAAMEYYLTHEGQW